MTKIRRMTLQIKRWLGRLGERHPRTSTSFDHYMVVEGEGKLSAHCSFQLRSILCLSLQNLYIHIHFKTSFLSIGLCYNH